MSQTACSAQNKKKKEERQGVKKCKNQPTDGVSESRITNQG
jgi:hypothetical protein